jgi:hypothetical protein
MVVRIDDDAAPTGEARRVVAGDRLSVVPAG